jgi:tetratricopeptide (TPR) repeat protein
MVTELPSDAGRPDQALTLLQQVLILCRSSETEVAVCIAKQYASRCNALSVLHPDFASRLLKAAETILKTLESRLIKEKETGMQTILRVTLLTYNNWANHHKAGRNYHKALSYLMKATKRIQGLGEYRSPGLLGLCAKTQLNISALYAELRRYPETIAYAEQCLGTLQEELRKRLTGRPLEDLSAKEQAHTEDLMRTYVAAFYNIGKAQEAMGHSNLSLQAYSNALAIGTKFLPKDSNEIRAVSKALSKSNGKSSEDTGTALTERVRSASPRRRKQINPLLTQREKYYSQERLTDLHKRLHEGTAGLKLVTADEFFMKKITAKLDVSRDAPHLRSLSRYFFLSTDLVSAQRQELIDRRVLSTLRQRRHPFHIHPDHIRGKELVTGQISRIEKELEAMRKRKEVRTISRSAAKAFQAASKHILFEQVRQPPPQRKQSY